MAHSASEEDQGLPSRNAPIPTHIVRPVYMDHCSKRGFGVMRRHANALALHTMLDDEEAVLNLVRDIDELSLYAAGAEATITEDTEFVDISTVDTRKDKPTAVTKGRAASAKEKAASAAIRDPTTWQEAMTRKDAARWIEAIRKEQQSIMDNGTFHSA